MKFFDLDNCITKSRQKISPKMKKKLATLGEFVVISGAGKRQMQYQLDDLDCEILAQSGNNAPGWRNELEPEEKTEILNHINKFGFPVQFLLEDRGCQMSYSFVGHQADQIVKDNFDPKQKIRALVLKKFPFVSKTLVVKVAGTTCLDYTKKNGTKGKNIERYIKENHLNKKDCVYYGDALFKGGNDETVLGVIRCIKVKNPDDLYKKLCKKQ